MNKWYLALDPESYPIEHWEEIKKALAITIEGWEDFDFCLHKVASGTWRGCWRVTEGRSGAQIATADTRAEAVAAAERYLDKRGRVAAQEAIARAVRLYGPSPRYQDERGEACSETRETT